MTQYECQCALCISARTQARLHAGRIAALESQNARMRAAAEAVVTAADIEPMESNRALGPWLSSAIRELLAAIKGIPMTKLYGPRNLPELEPHYSRHVSAMTTEALHAKSEIAAELAWRDKRIAELEASIHLQSKFAPRCRQCSKPVEPQRYCYATPICYACLPPPEPLPTVTLKEG